MIELLQTTILRQFLSVLRHPPRAEDPAQLPFSRPGSSDQHEGTEFPYANVCHLVTTAKEPELGWLALMQLQVWLQWLAVKL